jgi:signal transduction histidine kinase
MGLAAAQSILKTDPETANAQLQQIRNSLNETIREAITNSLRHGKALKLRISLKPLNDKIELIVADDGIGFDSTQKSTAVTDCKIWSNEPTPS